jgi:hypothetical protein
MEPRVLDYFKSNPVEFRGDRGVLTYSEEDVSESLGEVAGGIHVEFTSASSTAFTAVDLER